MSNEPKELTLFRLNQIIESIHLIREWSNSVISEILNNLNEA